MRCVKKSGVDPQAAGELSVGQVAAQSGVAISAVYFYEDKGLISGRRMAGGQRRYAADVLQRVLMIRAAQSAGAPLAAVRDMLLLLPGERAPTAHDWGTLLSRWQANVEQNLARLAQLRSELTGCGRCGCLCFESCPLVTRAAHAARKRSSSDSGPHTR